MLKYKIGDRIICRCLSTSLSNDVKDPEKEFVIIGSRKNGVASAFCEYVLFVPDDFNPDFGWKFEDRDIDNKAVSSIAYNYDGIDKKYFEQRAICVVESYIVRLACKQKCSICVKQNDK